MPPGNQAGLIGAAHQQIVQTSQRGHVELIACLGESAVGDAAHRLGAVAQRGEKRVEGDLLRLAMLGNLRGDQAWQGQLASAGKRLREVGVGQSERSQATGSPGQARTTLIPLRRRAAFGIGSICWGNYTLT